MGIKCIPCNGCQCKGEKGALQLWHFPWPRNFDTWESSRVSGRLHRVDCRCAGKLKTLATCLSPKN